jgi:hypothetical protein
MNVPEPSPCLLAASGFGHQAFDLGDGTVRLDVGNTSLRFSHSEFGMLVGMIEAARLRPDTPDDGLLAYNQHHCGIWRCPQRGTLAIVVDRAIVRLSVAEIDLFAALCRSALAKLQRLAQASECSTMYPHWN